MNYQLIRLNTLTRNYDLITKINNYKNNKIPTRFIAKFVVFSKGFFCSVNHLSGGGVNANRDATHSPSLALKNKTENDSRLLKNSEGNRDNESTFCRGQGQTLLNLFLRKTRIRKIRKIFEEN